MLDLYVDLSENINIYFILIINGEILLHIVQEFDVHVDGFRIVDQIQRQVSGDLVS